MYGCIDLPSPFAPVKELQKSLKSLATLPQDDPQVRRAIQEAKSNLRNAQMLEASARKPGQK